MPDMALFNNAASVALLPIRAGVCRPASTYADLQARLIGMPLARYGSLAELLALLR